MNTLLVPIDFSATTQAVVDTAAKLARSGPSRIVLIHVVRPPVLVAEYGGALEGSAATIEASEASAERLLRQWEAALRRRKIRTAIVRRNGFPATEIALEARKQSASMIVMGSHGHTAFYDLLIGATAGGVLRKARCPVVIVPSVAGPSASASPARRRR